MNKEELPSGELAPDLPHARPEGFDGFPLGRLVATPGSLAMLESLNLRPDNFLARHAAGDWGDICAEDAGLNDEALRYGDRLISVYKIQGKVLWIITEYDRSVTTLLLPEEY